MSANIRPITPDVGFATWGANATEYGFEGANQTWNTGAPLTYSNGNLIELTGGNNNTNQAGLIVGIALAPAYGVNNAVTPTQDIGTPTSGYDPYIPISPDVFTFAVTVDNALVSSNAPGNGSLAANALYQRYQLQRDGVSKNWYLNATTANATTYANVVVVGFIDPPATVNGRVRVKFMSTMNFSLSPTALA